MEQPYQDDADSDWGPVGAMLATVFALMILIIV